MSSRPRELPQTSSSSAGQGRTRLIAVAASARWGLCAVFLACRPPAGAQATAVEPASVAVPLTAQPRAIEALPAAKHALELMPAETLAHFEVRHPARAMVELGVPKVLTHGGMVTQGASLVLDAETRGLIENPERVREYGVDPDGSMGIALLDLRAEAFAGWVTLSDPQLALDTIEKRSGRELEFQGGRGGRYARLDAGTQIIVRDKVLLFVHAGRVDALPTDFARDIAGADPRSSLASTKPYTRAFPTDEGELARAFVAPAVMLANARRPDWGNNDAIRQLEDELEQARRDGADAQRLADKERALEDMRRYATQRSARQQRELDFAQLMVGSVESVSMRMTSAPGHLQARTAVKFSSSDATLARLVGAIGSSSSWLATTEATPLGLMEVGFDAAVAFDIFRAAVEADGENFAQVEAEFTKETGFDLKQDLFDQLSGQAAIGTYFRRLPRLDKDERGEDVVDVAFTVGVRDAARVGQMLDQLSKRLPHAKVKRDAKHQGYSIEIDRGRRAYVAMAGQRFVFSTDAEWLTRLQKGEVGAGASKLARPELRRPFEQNDHFARGLLDYTWPVLMEARPPYTRSLKQFDGRFEHYRGMEPRDVKRQSWSRAERSKRAKLKKLYAKLNKLNSSSAIAELETQLGWMRRFGHFAAQGREVADGFEGSFDLYHQGTTVVELALDMADQVQAEDDNTKVRELQEQVSVLEQELERARYEQLDRWVAKHPDKSAERFPIP